MSFDHIFFLLARARAPPTLSTLETVQTSPAPLYASVRTVRSSERVLTGAQEKRENVFKNFPMREISTVSRPPPGAYQKKSTKRREIRILRCRNRRATTSFRRPDCPSKRNSFPSTSNARAGVKKSNVKKKENVPPEPQRLAFPFPQGRRPLPP